MVCLRSDCVPDSTFSSDNGSQMRLTDADAAKTASSDVGFVHFILLVKEVG